MDGFGVSKLSNPGAGGQGGVRLGESRQGKDFQTTRPGMGGMAGRVLAMRGKARFLNQGKAGLAGASLGRAMRGKARFFHKRIL